MTTNIVITLDLRRPKNDGTYPLIMRLGHHRRTIAIPLDIFLHPKDWNEKERVVKTSYKGVSSPTWLNNHIHKIKSEAMDVIFKMQEAKKLDRLSVSELRDQISGKSKDLSFFIYAEQLIDDLKVANRIGTASSYRDVFNIVKGYAPKGDLTFKNIDYAFLMKMEKAHLSKGNSYNGLAVYMRTIRAMFNKAIKAGKIDKELYPFATYKIRTVPTEKRALDTDLLQKLIDLSLADKHPCFNARNYFVASYMMYGMNYTDMAFLKKENIIDGRIQYRRKKTSKLYDIKITDNLKFILQYYLAKTPDSAYVFPILKSKEATAQFKEIRWSRKRYNNKLDDLAKLCEIQQNLTSYVSRHSFATQALLMQIPLAAISAMMGHSSLKTTEVYLKSLPSSILDDYNAKLLEPKKNTP